MFNSYSDEIRFHNEYQKLMTEYLEAIKDFNFEEMKQINNQIDSRGAGAKTPAFFYAFKPRTKTRGYFRDLAC